MKNRIFISHCHADTEIARVLAENIYTLSMNTIDSWFSSDPRPNGGIEAGDIIFNRIIECINKSIATIVILTPRSIDRPWIYFESGMAQNKKKNEVIPVCIGIDRDSITPPLIHYSCYQLSDVDSLSEFVVKLFGKVNLIFDKNVHRQALQDFISSLQDATKKTNDKYKTAQKNLNITQTINNLKDHIDKRIMELIEPNEKSKRTITSYTVPIKIDIGPNKGTTEYIKITEYDTVQKILDKIYFLLNGTVAPYTYMSSWVLQEISSGAYMVMYEVTNLVPAKYIFGPDLKWKVVSWDDDYKAANSNFYAGIFNW